MPRPVLSESTRAAWAEATLAGGLAALVASTSAAQRAMTDDGSLASTWLAASGFVTPLFVLAVGAARAGLRALRPRPEAASWLGFAAFFLWAASSLVAWSALGAALQAHTHHRGLGGVTFAVVALGVSATVAVALARAVAVARGLVRTRPALAPALAGGALVVAGILALAATARPLARGLDLTDAPEAARAIVADGSLACLAVTLAALTPWPSSSWLRKLGPVLALVLVGRAAFAFGVEPAVTVAIARHTALAGAVVEALGRHVPEVDSR